MRNRPVRALLAALAAVSLLLSACSSDEPTPTETAQGDGTRLGEKKDDKKAGGGKQNGAGENGSGKSKPGKGGGSGGPAGGGGGGNGGGSGSGAEPDDVAAAPGDAGAPDGSSLGREGGPTPRDPSLARESTFVDDSGSDAKKEGITPPHAELIQAGIQGIGEQFEMRMTFGGAVPQKTEDKNTVMVIGVGISAGGNDTYGFTAQGTQEGWKAYAGAKDGAKKFPGQFLIEGDTIIMRVPWSFINGPRAFNWQVNSTWFRSIANTTHYSFDMAPNEEAAKFPG